MLHNMLWFYSRLPTLLGKVIWLRYLGVVAKENSSFFCVQRNPNL
jgi:hypothetical protein